MDALDEQVHVEVCGVKKWSPRGRRIRRGGSSLRRERQENVVFSSAVKTGAALCIRCDVMVSDTE